MAVTVRTPAPEELERFMDVHRTAFNTHWDADLRGRVRETLLTMDDYALHAAYDGAEMVGTAMSIPLTLSLPGGQIVKASGLSWVATLPGHRRRGVMSSLTRAHLDCAREREAVASLLLAADSILYGRYGYGPATQECAVAVELGRVQLRTPAAGRRVRYVEAADSVPLMQKIWHAAQAVQPGMTSRPDPEVVWWASRHEGFVVVAEDEAGEADGYAAYTVARGRDPGDLHSAHKVSVGELIAASPAAYGALWSALLELDMATEVSAVHRPLDEPLVELVTAPRRITRTNACDSLWLCPLEPAALLAARAYRPGPPCVLDVAGTGLRIDPAGGVEPTPDAADIALGASELGQLVLGGGGGAALAFARRIQGDGQRADALFDWSPAPWSPLDF